MIIRPEGPTVGPPDPEAVLAVLSAGWRLTPEMAAAAIARTPPACDDVGRWLDRWWSPHLVAAQCDQLVAEGRARRHPGGTYSAVRDTEAAFWGYASYLDRAGRL